MRILHIVTAWPRDPTDVITPWLVQLADRQVGRGHTVDVLAPSYRGDGLAGGEPVRTIRFRYAPSCWERLTHEEATVDRLQRTPAYGALIPIYVAAGSLAAWRTSRRNRYHVVHVHWAVPHGVPGWFAARARDGTRLVTTFYGAELRWAEKRFPPARAFLRWYCRRSELIAISSSTRAALRPYTDRPVSVIPYGIGMPEPGRSGPVASDDDTPRLLFVGRLVRRKGVNRLLEALSRIDDHAWHLEVIGDGPEREPLIVLAERLGLTDRVSFPGRVPTAELEAAYARATAFVLPATLDERADTEGLGVVLLEAMAYGVPVLATAMGGITDIVVDGETGLLVEDDIDALAGGVARLIGDPRERRLLGERGRSRVNEVFGWDGIVDRIEGVYASGSDG